MNVAGTELSEGVKVEDTERSKSDNKSTHENKYTSLQRPAGKLTLRRLSYIYGAPILDVSRSHTTTQHSR